MKGFYIFPVTLFCVTACKAQVEFRVFGGPHLSSASYSVSGEKQSTEYKFGFHLGAGYKIPFENKLFFAPAVSYKKMGYKVVFSRPSFPPDLLATDNNTTFHEIDIDPLLQCDLGKHPGHFFLSAGPSFNFILWGKEKFNLATGQQINRNMKFSVLNGYGRYGVSAVGQLGFQSRGGFAVDVHYVQGLMSMNNEDGGPRIKNQLFGMTCAIFFKGQKQ